ncbi:ribonuclease HII [Patescibacteria group bacterium]|nr:ribonuclease HII [Patescibacteria group bacterium]
MVAVILPTFALERDLTEMGFKRILGIDEVGMGSFAGPLTCGGVIYNREMSIKNVRDSKTLSEKQREEVYEKVSTLSSIEYATMHAPVEEIDSFGIRTALINAVERLIDCFSPPPDYILVDGKYLAPFKVQTQFVPKGDRYSMSIALASIVAKVTRDRLLREKHNHYPQYNFKSNKGYGSKEHQKALTAYGPTPFHRKSYAPIARLIQK